MSEIKCYVLTIPDDEIFHLWMNDERSSIIFDRIDTVGVNSDENGLCHHLLFRTTEDLKEAYKVIHEVFPESLCAYNPMIAYVDSKYLDRKKHRA